MLQISSLPTRRRALMLSNPNARRGALALDPLVKQFENGGIDVIVERFETPDELVADIVRRRNEVDLIIVGGGDGTINAAARGVYEAGLPMGILPMGTANDLARTLDIPLALDQAAEIIIAGHTRLIDLGDVNGFPFFNVATIGLGADLASGLTADAKRRWGRLGYALEAFKVLLAARPFSAKIVTKGKERRVKTFQIAVGNGRHYGGGTIIEESASIEDGTLDLYSLEMDNVWKFALMLSAFRKGTHGAWDEVQTERCVEFDIHTRHPRPVNTDGDIVTHTPAHFRIRPKAISVFAPPD
jgi:diacylglycerol kinase (ATP)